MKNFLSYLLVLAMLIVQVGSLYSFADKRQDDKIIEAMKAMRPKKLKIVIEIDRYGRFMVKYNLLKKAGKIAKEKELPKEVYVAIDEILAQTHILRTIKKLKCDRAFIVFEGYARGVQFLRINFCILGDKVIKSEKYIVFGTGACLFKQ